MQILDDEFTLPDDYNQQDVLSGQTVRNLMFISGWAIFLSVTGLIAMVFVWLVLFEAGKSIGEMVQVGALGYNPVLFELAPYMEPLIILTGLGVFTQFVLIGIHARFAFALRKSLRSGNQALFEKAWRNMRNFLRFTGIFMLIALVFMAILINLVRV